MCGGCRFTLLAVLIGLVGGSTSSISEAEVNDKAALCDVLTIQFENDEFGGSDRHYTNGLRLACTARPPRFVRDRLPRPAGRDLRTSRITYAAGHSIYTPDDLVTREPIPDDQPYAGWLYVSLGLETQTIPKAVSSVRYVDHVELQLGVVGPLAGGKQLQSFTHDVLNASPPAGWDNQLDNEPGVNLFYSRSFGPFEGSTATPDNRKPRLFLDVTPEVGLALGNIQTYGAAGFTVRLGNHLPDDAGPATLRPSLPRPGAFSGRDRSSAYIFAGLEGRAVARNIFLDGNSFDDDGPSVDKKTLVGEARVGVAVTYHDLSFSYTQVFRTREFADQAPQTYGSITVSVGL